MTLVIYEPVVKPDHAGAHNNLAISCKKLGRIGEAIAHYRGAIRLQPDPVEALNNLAWILAAHTDAGIWAMTRSSLCSSATRSTTRTQAIAEVSLR